MSASVLSERQVLPLNVLTVGNTVAAWFGSRQPLNLVLMETPAHIAAQRIVGGSLALDLLNTQNGPAGGTPEDDALRDYGDVVAWAAYVGLLRPRKPPTGPAVTPPPGGARAVFERVVETRAYLYDCSGDRDGQARRLLAIARLQRTRPTPWPTATSSARRRLRVALGRRRPGRPLWPVIHEALRS